MKNCLIIINRSAGKSRKISFEKVEKCLGNAYRYTRFLLPDDGEYELADFDAVAVCGGDGTLGSLLEKAYALPIVVYYFPAGTLNDRAKSKRYEHAKRACPACSDSPESGRPVVLGRFAKICAAHESSEMATAKKSPYAKSISSAKKFTEISASQIAEQSEGYRLQDETLDRSAHEICSSQGAADGAEHAFATFDFPEESGVFSYVLAAGSFTPIGYSADAGLKRRLGALAYVLQILKQYKVCRIPATIRCGRESFSGDFTLIMALKSPRCFGFHFNRAFDAESISGHLIAIRSPRHGGLLGLIEMFFPFFRVFFLGLKKERAGNIIFKRIYSCDITQGERTTYCRDGEKYVSEAGTLRISFVRSLCDFAVIDKF